MRLNPFKITLSKAGFFNFRYLPSCPTSLR